VLGADKSLKLYVNGKLVGGCDIVSGLEQNGELDRLIEA